MFLIQYGRMTRIKVTISQVGGEINPTRVGRPARILADLVTELNDGGKGSVGLDLRNQDTLAAALPGLLKTARREADEILKASSTERE